MKQARIAALKEAIQTIEFATNSIGVRTATVVRLHRSITAVENAENRYALNSLHWLLVQMQTRQGKPMLE